MRIERTLVALLFTLTLVAPLGLQAGDDLKALQNTKAETPCPPDFMAYWNKQKARLKKVPMRAVAKPATLKPTHWNKQVKAFDVRIDCIGDAPATGYLVMPKDASKTKKYPIKVTLHGFTSAPRGAHIYARQTVMTNLIHFDINPHGNKNGQPLEYYKDIKNTFPKGARHFREYAVKNWDNLEENYFRGMFIRVVRALEYAKTLDEWDGKNLIVWGSSMGGAQALVGAALDPDVTMCFANVPALADHLAKTPGWPQIKRRYKPDVIKKTAPYLDMVNFALQIKAKTFIGVGLNDKVCPPSTVFAIYNNVQGVKQIEVDPKGVHGWNNFPKAAEPVLREWLVK